MTLTGNVMHDIMARDATKPALGMGATILLYSDRIAGTITDIFNVGQKTFIEVTRDISKRTDSNGMSDTQEYEYFPVLNGEKFYFCTDKNLTKVWTYMVFNKETNRWNQSNGYRVRVGTRDAYYDYGF